MKKRSLCLTLVAAASIVIATAAQAGTVNKCIAVGTTATPIFTPNVKRIAYTIATTSGSVVVYFNDAGGTPVVPADANSIPLAGGASYTYDGPFPAPTGNVKVVSKSGTAYVCGTEESR